MNMNIMSIIGYFTNELINKPSWAFALLLSLIYAVAYHLVSSGLLDGSDLLFGFCVWGSPDMPSVEAPGCKNARVNSHLLAFIIDVVMTILAGVFYVMDKREEKIFSRYIVTGFIILLHGILHWFLQQTRLPIVVNCYNPDLSHDIQELGFTIFASFSFLLGFIILWFGFGGLTLPFVGSTFFTILVVLLTKNTAGDLILSGLFVIVHPLSSLVGLLSDDPAFHPGVAKLFAVCTFVGILELSACNNVLRPLGGHLWYDLGCSLAVLASLPYFSDDIVTKSKTN